MANFFSDNDDLRYYLDKGLDWGPLVELTEYFYRSEGGHESAPEAVQFYTDILELIGEFVADEIAPHAAEIDRDAVDYVDGEAVLPPRQQGIFKAIDEMELHGMSLPRELGGQNCPLVVYLMATEVFARADVSVCAHYGFHGGMAMAALVFSIREGSTEYDLETSRIKSTRFSEMIEEIRTGKAWGCMDITEPDAGSDMAALRAVGEQDDEGNWFVSGQKIFITSGHGKWHFVIARTEKPGDTDDPFAGLGGLSMFLVPTYHDDADGNRTRVVSLDRLEEKLGHHGSATAALTFERAPAELIGKRGEGFKYMLTLMNNARLGVGVECLGLCEASLRAALDYAAERRTMGKSIDRHEMIADYLDEMATDIQGIRALVYAGAMNEELAHKTEILAETGMLSDDPRARWYAARRKQFKATSRRYTPLVKYIAAEKAVEMSRRCVQIHGGSGYTTEYGAEKLLRDAMVMPIYEGTSQIQSLMAMKDTLTGVLKDPQAYIKRAAQARWRSLSARDPLERRVARLQVQASQTVQHLLMRTVGDKTRGLRGKPLAEWPQRFLKDWNPKKDFAYAMLHAERLTRILVDEAICEVLLAQAQRHPERAPILERYIERAEPRCRFLHDEIVTTGDRLLAQLKEGEEKVEERKAAS